MKKIILSIDGMTCSACSNGLEKYLNKQECISQASVNLVMANATIEYDEKRTNLKQIEGFIKEAGFKSLGEFKEISIEQKSKNQKIKLLFFTVLAGILMYISMGHMLKLPIISFLNPMKNPKNYTICLFVLASIFLIYGLDILKNGYKNLIHKTPNMDTLVSIGVITSFLYSVYNMYLILIQNNMQTTNLYFESSAMIIYFIKLGRYIDGISKDKTKEAIQKLVKITPNTATIKIGKESKIVTIDEIKKGDIIISKAGEKIAVDGEIIFGKTHLDESFITGESKPVSKEIGDKVIAGSLNYDGYIEYKATRIGKESTISEIVRLVVEATNTKAPIATLADKVSSYFIPTVILIAILTMLLYLISGRTLENSLITFVTILVVACPCSLGLATPLAIIVSEGLCATNGILIKKSEILENASKTNTIVFDKTGTLTYGKLKITEILNYSTLSKKQLLQLVGSIEKNSTHPIALPFINYLKDNKIPFQKVDHFTNLAGYGIQAEINQEKILIGNEKLLEKNKITNPYKQDEEILSNQGNSIIYVVKNKEIIALIGVNDKIRPETKKVINQLKNKKINIIMLTGDNEKTAKMIAKEIGITNIISNVLPTEKNKIIHQLKQENKIIMMCGDGINDSPALASANIGLTIQNATDIAIDSSDVILTNNNLSSILTLIQISQKTIHIIKQNLFWAFFYNLLMIPIAMGVFKNFGISINPMIASIAMIFSSLTVILNTLRLKKQK